MSSPAIDTVSKMLETLPENAQDQVVEHLRDYIEDLQDEIKWDSLVEDSGDKLVEAARRAKREIAAGKARPLDLDQL